MDVRRPVVAGSFYSSDSIRLKEEIKKCFLNNLGPGEEPEINPKGEGKILGLVSPHAGYIYSGPAAADGFYHLAQDQVPELVVIIGPNHSSYVSPVATSTQDAWETPLGSVSINREVAHKIMDYSNGLIEDNPLSHQSEHSLEVQLPFLQYTYRNGFQFIPICMVDQTLEASIKVGKSVAKALSEIKNKSVIIASTDFTHYESHQSASSKDKQAIEAILRLDPELLLLKVQEFSVSMCGVGPVMAMLVASKEMGAKKGELLTYYTSGDVTGDKAHVVGYGSIKIVK